MVVPSTACGERDWIVVAVRREQPFIPFLSSQRRKGCSHRQGLLKGEREKRYEESLGRCEQRNKSQGP